MATIQCPVGTYGLVVVAPWSDDEVFAVAADWRQASSPVQTWNGERWTDSGRQVADYRHDPAAALVAELREACDSAEQAETLAAEATAIYDTDAEEERE